MMSNNSLEAQREAILSRLHSSREEYRRLLNGEGPSVAYERHVQTTQAYKAQASAHAEAAHVHAQAAAADMQAARSAAPGHASPAAPAHVPRQPHVNRALTVSSQPVGNWRSNPVLALFEQHPLVCAAVVAAVVAVGPRRISQAFRSTNATLSELSTTLSSNQHHIETITRVLNTVATMLQQRNPPRY